MQEKLEKKIAQLCKQEKWWLLVTTYLKKSFKILISSTVFKPKSTQQWIPKKLKFRYFEKATKNLDFI